MNTNELLNLIQTLKETGYSHIDVAHEGSHIVLSNIGPDNKDVMAVENKVEREVIYKSEPQQVLMVTETANEEKLLEHGSEAIEEVSKGGHIVESPIVGTFYSASGPDADDFVTVGSKVKKGNVLCIIEAMKLMNEIEADEDGEIVEILVENEAGVEYGQPLFRIK